MSFKIGDRVETGTTSIKALNSAEKNGKGVVAFFGKTKFADGDWVGVILDEQKGKNNGTVQDEKYFECEPNFGLFVRPSQLKPESARAAKASALRAPRSTGNLRKSTPGSTPGVSPAVSQEQLAKAKASTPPDPPASSSKSSVKAKSSEDKKPKDSSPKKVEQQSPSEPHTPTVKDRAQLITEEPERIIVNNNFLPPATEKQFTALPTVTNVSETTEIDILRQENHDLTEKLETLRIKRKEDQVALQEYKLLQIRVQGLVESKEQVTDMLALVQRQLAEKEIEVTELTAWRTLNQEQIANHDADMEMLVLDKEISESKYEVAAAEVEDLRTRLEELETENALLKEQIHYDEDDDTPVSSIVHMRSLEEKNEKLSVACLKLRDTAFALTEEKQNFVRELESLRAENQGLYRELEVSKRTEADAMTALAFAREQADNQIESVRMVDNLTSINLELEQRIRVLECEVEDYESLRQLDEQLLDAQKQTELDLHHDIAEKGHKISEVYQLLSAEIEHGKVLSETILKFRKKVDELNEQLQEAKDQALRYEEALSAARGESTKQAAATSYVVTSQSKIVDAAQKTIEVDSLSKVINYLKAFMPDNFTKSGGDFDSILITALFPRMQAKAQQLANFADERFPSVPGGMRKEHVTQVHKAEQWAQCAKLRALTSSISRLCAQFDSAVSQCSMDALARLAEMHSQFSSQEKLLDFYFDLLKQGRFDENTQLDLLEKTNSFLLTAFTVHMNGRAFDTRKWLIDTLQHLASLAAWAKLNSQQLSLFVPEEAHVSELYNGVVHLQNQMSALEGLMHGTVHRVPAEKTINVDAQLTDLIAKLESHLDKLCSTLHEAASTAATQLSISDADAYLDSSRVGEILHTAIEKQQGTVSADKAFEVLNNWVLVTRELSATLNAQIDDGSLELDPPSKTNYPPILERAMVRKQAAADAEGLKWQIEKKDNEANELKRTIRARIDDITHLQMRLEMAEKRVESSDKAQDAKAQHWEQKFEQLSADMKRKEAELDQKIVTLQQINALLVSEINELRESAKNHTRSTMMTSLKSNYSTSNQNGHSENASSAECAYFKQQAVDLEKRLRYTVSELHRVEVEKSALALRSIPAVPNKVCGRDTLDYYMEHDAIKKQILDLHSQGIKMTRDMLRFDTFRPTWTDDVHLQHSYDDWLRQRLSFENRAIMLRDRAVNLAKKIDMPAMFIRAIILGFPTLVPLECKLSFDVLLSNLGIELPASMIESFMPNSPQVVRV